MWKSVDSNLEYLQKLPISNIVSASTHAIRAVDGYIKVSINEVDMSISLHSCRASQMSVSTVWC